MPQKKNLHSYDIGYALYLFIPIIATLLFKCLKRRTMMTMIIPKVLLMTVIASILIFSTAGISYQQVELPFNNNNNEEEEAGEEEEEEEEEASGEEEAAGEEEEAAGEEEACIDYEA